MIVTISHPTVHAHLRYLLWIQRIALWEPDRPQAGFYVAAAPGRISRMGKKNK